MNEAQGENGKAKLPRCRGRHPHLGGFEPDGCGEKTRLILIGASNLWFPATQSIIVMPESQQERHTDLADQIRIALGEKLAKYRHNLDMIRDLLETGKVNVAALSDDELGRAVATASAPPTSAAEQEQQLPDWDPVNLLVPEWQYLLKDPVSDHHSDPISGLTLSRRDLAHDLRTRITRILAVERLRKVNALVGSLASTTWTGWGTCRNGSCR